MDRALFEAVNRGLAAAWLDAAMLAVSWLYGPGIWLVVPLAAAALWRRGRGLWRLVAAPLAASFVSTVLKHALERPRPAAVLDGVRVVGERLVQNAMPSGHTTVAFAVGVWVWLADRRAGAVALPLAVFVAFSRIYLGAHWPSDTLAGAMLGAGVALLLRPRPGGGAGAGRQPADR